MTCITGIGTAFKFKNLMEKSLLNDFDINIIACEYTRLKTVVRRYRCSTSMKLFVGTHDPQLAGVPRLALRNYLASRGIDI